MLYYDKMKSSSKKILLHASLFLFNRGHLIWHAFNADWQKWNSGFFAFFGCHPPRAPAYSHEQE